MADQPQSHWDSMYNRANFHYGTHPNRWIEFAVERYVRRDAPVRRAAVDLGAGEGRNAVYLATRGFSVTAYDTSRVGLEKARRLVAELRKDGESDSIGDVATRVRDVLEIAEADADPSLTADLVVSSFFHVTRPDRERMLAAHGVLARPGGMVIGEWFHPDQRLLGMTSGGPPHPEMMVRPTDLKRAFTGWEILACRRVERVLDEGPGHVGDAVVTQFAAVKPGT